MKNLLAIGLIWLGCAIAWVVLGSTILFRTGTITGERSSEVQLLWGPALRQAPPTAVYHEKQKRMETTTVVDASGKSFLREAEKEQDIAKPIQLTASDIAAKLNLEHRRKGLLWFPTYQVDFRARFEFRNDTETARNVELSFPVQAESVVYDGFGVRSEDGTPVPVTIRDGSAQWVKLMAPGQTVAWTVSYRARGTSQWYYHPTAGAGQVKNFKIAVDADFSDIDFPAGTLSPTRHGPQGGGWHGEWTFESLVTSSTVGIELPQKLNPGPLASRITFFAPVGLLFFVFVVAVLASAQRQKVHPLNYFFFGCAFFAFHLLFAYLVDHLAIGPSLAVSSGVSILLVVTYARLFVGWRFALVEMGLSQLIYLVLFSITFLWEGYTGLAITVGAVLTLFAIMQVTGRVSWSELTTSQNPDR